MRASIDDNKKDADKKMNKFREKLDSIHDKLIGMVEHVFHQILIYSPENDVEDDGLSEITKSTYKTNPSKSDPSSF